MSGYKLGSTGNGESLFHHRIPFLVSHQLSAQLRVLVLELPHTGPKSVGGVLLLFVSDGEEDAEDGDEDKGDVEHGLSFRRIFNIQKENDAESLYPKLMGYKVQFFNWS